MDKDILGVVVIAILAVMQGAAWYMGKDGAVFALTSLVIGGIAGSIFGFKIGLTKAKK